MNWRLLQGGLFGLRSRWVRASAASVLELTDFLLIIVSINMNRNLITYFFFFFWVASSVKITLRKGQRRCFKEEFIERQVSFPLSLR